MSYTMEEKRNMRARAELEEEGSSEGLIGLLLRNGVTPTFNYKADIELARQFMPPDYNEYLKKLTEG
jgi:hypothetical protein